jgi:hypothetical protein
MSLRETRIFEEKTEDRRNFEEEVSTTTGSLL